MPKPVTGSTKDYYVRPGTTTATKYGSTSNKTYTTSTANNTKKNPTTYYIPTSDANKIKQQGTQNIFGSVGSGKMNTASATNKSSGYVPPSNAGSVGGGVGNAGNVVGGGTGGSTVTVASGVQSTPQDNYMQNYINQMQSAIQSAQKQAEEAQRRAEEQMKAAQEAQRKAREEAYNRSAAQQKTDYEYGQGNLNAATDSALQQAYINNMMQRRNLGQLLSAQGLNGGASESTTAGMLNNYSNSRNALETERQNQLASLMNTYQNNMAQLENQRASGDAADLSQYQTNLSNLTANNANQLISLMQGYANIAANMPQLRPKFNTTTGQWEYSYT